MMNIQFIEKIALEEIKAEQDNMPIDASTDRMRYHLGYVDGIIVLLEQIRNYCPKETGGEEE